MQKIKKLLLTLLISYVVVLSVNIAANYDYYLSGGNWRFSVGFSLSITTLGWLGFVLLYDLLFSKMIDWKKHPNRSLLTAVLISGVYGVLLMVVFMKVMVMTGMMNEQPQSEYVNNAIYSALFSMLIGLIVTGMEFLKQWKKSAEDNERMKAEMISSQFEALKNQVNPHFLFNSLNTLAAIIPEKPEVAIDFVQQLSRVFRYALQNSEQNMVTISEELRIIQSYLFLNKQRFGDKLRTDIRIAPAVAEQKILTHALLILVENAIKHNEISTNHPLDISIAAEDGCITVANNLRLKQVPEPSTGIGLSNIRNRYRLVSERTVTVSVTAHQFIVKIPILPA